MKRRNVKDVLSCSCAKRVYTHKDARGRTTSTLRAIETKAHCCKLPHKLNLTRMVKSSLPVMKTPSTTMAVVTHPFPCATEVKRCRSGCTSQTVKVPSL